MSRRFVLVLAFTAVGCGLVAGIEDLTYDEAPVTSDDASTLGFNDPVDAAGVAVTVDPPLEAGCTSIGPLEPQEVSLTGSGNAWSMELGIKKQDDLPAVGAACCAGDATRSINVSSFGFTVPETATITGVKLLLRARSGVPRAFRDAELKLARLSSGGGFGDDLRSDLPYDGEYTLRQYGGPTELWGAPLTPDVVNATDFGVTYRSVKPRFQFSLDMNHQIDAISLTVYYCPKPAVIDGGT